MPDGSNVYKVLTEKMAAFQTKLLAETDDTVSYLLLVKVSATNTIVLFNKNLVNPCEKVLYKNRLFD